MEILSQASLISAQVSRSGGPNASERSAQRALREDQAASRTERAEDTPPPRDEPVDRVEVRNRAEDEAVRRAEQDRVDASDDNRRRDDGVGRREAPIAARPETYERPGSRFDITV